MNSIRAMPLIAVASLVALLLAAMMLAASFGTPALAAHVGFALGVMPLILGAMAYFVPVLTRSSEASTAAWLPPLLAVSGGVLIALALFSNYSDLLVGSAALMGGTAAAGLGTWAVLRARRMVGRRHAGLDWYLAALAMLLLALGAIACAPFFPDERANLRLFHLHANLLGFIGLTAVGTLQVLLPTCLGMPDPEVGRRLHSDLKWAMGGALLIALGAASPWRSGPAAVSSSLMILGAILYLVVIVRALRSWVRHFGAALFQLHSAQASLTCAALGLGAMIVLGTCHGAGVIHGRGLIAGFVVAFLLPLVSGAASQLMPVWLKPGPQTDWHRQLRRRLCRYGALRGLALLVLGLVLAVA